MHLPHQIIVSYHCCTGGRVNMHHIPCFLLQMDISVKHVIISEVPFGLLQELGAFGYGAPLPMQQKKYLEGQGHVPPEGNTYSHTYGVRHEHDCYSICFANTNRLPNVIVGCFICYWLWHWPMRCLSFLQQLKRQRWISLSSQFIPLKWNRQLLLSCQTPENLFYGNQVQTGYVLI